jgi:plastocyanin
MLNSIRKGTCVLAAATAFFATQAAAEELSVLIVDGAYFPEITYANTGDTILFTNESDVSHTVSGPAGTWKSGKIAVNGTYRLALAQNTPLTFSGVDSDGKTITGEITYEDAPLAGH